MSEVLSAGSKQKRGEALTEAMRAAHVAREAKALFQSLGDGFERWWDSTVYPFADSGFEKALARAAWFAAKREGLRRE